MKNNTINMRYPNLVLVALLALAYQSNGQNLCTREGLRFGKWKFTYTEHGKKSKQLGSYKIIPLSTYDTIETFGSHVYKIRYKGSTPLVFYDGQYNGMIAVKDSLWPTYDASGNLIELESWQQGINIWTQHFDQQGMLTRYEYDDLEKDTNFYLTYKNAQLFKKAYYPPEDKNNQSVIYYPDNNLVISDAEPSFHAIFNEPEACAHLITLGCKKGLTINSIQSSSDNIEISFPSAPLPYILSAKDSFVFKLIFHPSAARYRNRDTVSIFTSEQNAPPYRIYCALSAVHIDNKNVESLRELSLSKSKDKYLIIAPMGTVTDAYLSYSNKKKERHYSIRGITKIPLRKLAVGTHYLSIFSCDTGGRMTLNISK